MDTDAFLEHYGILGMRWGQRKKEEVNPVVDAYRTTQQSLQTNPKHYTDPKKKTHGVSAFAAGMILLGAGITLGMVASDNAVVKKGKSFVANMALKKTLSRKLITIPRQVKPDVRQTIRRVVPTVKQNVNKVAPTIKRVAPTIKRATPTPSSVKTHAKQVEDAYRRWM